jgi:hypothetical protein
LGLVDFGCFKWANLLRKTRSGLRRLYRPHLPTTSISDKQLLRLTDRRFSSRPALISHLSRRDNPRFFLDHRNKSAYVDIIRRYYPASIPATITKADQVCKHIFDLLGYRQQLPPKIDWNSDPRFGTSWQGYYLEIDFMNLERATDVRIPWELSRFQHFISLGRAYWYTGDEKYTREFVSQLDDWLRDNPAEWGVNWICTMEVALRAINWIRAYYLFLDSPCFTPEIQARLIKSLIQHGRHILSNLEGNPYGRFGNHYLTDGLGLFCLGLFFLEFKMGRRWLTEGLNILWRETQKQVYPDGADYEQSIDYHRQVLEFLLLAMVLCQRNNIPVPQAVKQRVGKMLEFTLSYTRPDGSIPMIGDADNGSLWSQGDNAHLSCLAVGAAIFSRPEFKTAELPEASFWLLGPDGLQAYESLPSSKQNAVKSTAYNQAGFYIMRHDSLHLVLHCSKYGLHGHNDILSLDLFAYGQHFVVDPGTYTYTGSYEWRNHFRSTFSHNTVRVDEQEFHPLSRETIWVVEGENSYRVINWLSSPEHDFFDAEHFCYHRLSQKVTHRRQVLFIKREGYFIINDLLSGPGTHKLELIFNLAPLQVSLSAAGVARCVNARGVSIFIIPDGENPLEAKLIDSWISYAYGVKQPTKKLVYIQNTTLPASFFTILYPSRAKSTTNHEQIKALAHKAWKHFKRNFLLT